MIDAGGPIGGVDSPSTATVDGLIGAVIDGRYRVLELLGTGGMGAVYKVEHTGMGKIAALKMIHPSLSADREVVKRFRREAQAISLLAHPNTVIGFHLDYLMAPAKRTKTILLEKAQLPGEVDREVELMNWEHFCGVKGPITEYPEFKSLLSDGRDRDTKVKTEGGLYNRAKGKILEAARRLMKDNIAPGPV